MACILRHATIRRLAGVLVITFFPAGSLFAQDSTLQAPPSPPDPPMPIFMPASVPDTTDSGSWSQTFDFPITVHFHGGQTLSGVSPVYYREFADSTDSMIYMQYIAFGDRTIIPAETDSVTAETSIPGLPEGESWLWRTVSGKLSLYVREPYRGSSDYGYFHKDKDTAGFVPYSSKAIEAAVSDNPAALTWNDGTAQGRHGRSVCLPSAVCARQRGL